MTGAGCRALTQNASIVRAVRGMKMAVRVPVAAYLGVAIRMEPPTGQEDGAVLIVLEHRDPALSASGLSRQ